MKTESNLAKWDRLYALPGEPRPYGDEATYRLAGDFLKPCLIVEDWGCGFGWARNFIAGHYRGIDGSNAPGVDEIADLTRYRTKVAGILIRHVLEHDYQWERILDNAVASFTKRLVLVLFTPMQMETRELAFNEDLGVPDIGFALEDIGAHFEGLKWRCQTLATATQYGCETIFYVEKAR
jgi:hypothetical protein